MTAPDHERLALLAVAQACAEARGVTPGHVSATVERVGSATRVLTGDFAPADRVEVRVRTAARTAVARPELAERLAFWATAGLRLTTVLDATYPPALRGIADRPPLLWHRGTLDEGVGLAVAVVGTREPSPHARRLARDIAGGLAAEGVTVVSGLARGIDAEAHAAALATGARTLAVLGHGLAQLIYPPENARLAEAVADRGALISTLFPTTPLSPNALRARNSVIAGLTAGSVVIEAGPRSGARIEARHAADHGRPVYVPRRLLEQEAWVRDFATTRDVVVIDDPADVVTDLAHRETPTPTMPPRATCQQLHFDEGDAT